MSKKTHSQDSNFEPKIAPLGSCYNYNKLKKEGEPAAGAGHIKNRHPKS